MKVGDVVNEKGLNVNSIKTENYSLILNCIRRKAMSRAEIAKTTGLTKSAVTIITKHLIEEGQIVETGTESIDYGRHPMMLDIVEKRRYAIGVSLTRKYIAVGVFDLKLQCVDSVSKNISEFKNPNDAFSFAYKGAMDIFEKHSIDKKLCLGIGVSAPGPIDYKKGIILTPPNFKMFENFNVKEALGKLCELPVFINNSPVLMAMYENFMRTPQIKNCIFIVVENGVGSAIIQNGSINKGFAGFSGEIGHTTVNINGPKCNCGNYGCLEEYITKRAIENKFNMSYEDIIDKAYTGDKKAVEIVEEIAFYFSTGIVNAINMLDVEAVIISGELNYRCDLLFGKIRDNVNERCFISKAHKIEIVPALESLKENNSFTATNVIDKYFRQELK